MNAGHAVTVDLYRAKLVAPDYALPRIPDRAAETVKKALDASDSVGDLREAGAQFIEALPRLAAYRNSLNARMNASRSTCAKHHGIVAVGSPAALTADAASRLDAPLHSGVQAIERCAHYVESAHARVNSDMPSVADFCAAIIPPSIEAESARTAGAAFQIRNNEHLVRLGWTIPPSVVEMAPRGRDPLQVMRYQEALVDAFFADQASQKSRVGSLVAGAARHPESAIAMAISAAYTTLGKVSGLPNGGQR